MIVDSSKTWEVGLHKVFDRFSDVDYIARVGAFEASQLSTIVGAEYFV